ncbi:MAG: polymer-forming cytoskeletal protein [Saprospiraceae bacterium]|nr:polymer-forming cytoskeletal protein [Saprospiraceae bacterium]
MLGKKNTPTKSGNTPGNFPGSATEGTCVISQGSNIEGQFSSKENVRLDGKVTGDVICENRLVMGESGSVEGTIKANEAVIMGTIKGNIEIKSTLFLKASAKINGNITAKLLSVEEGAMYNGECRIGG